MKKQYNKLVRDGVPQIIIESGRQCKTRTLSDQEYKEALLTKIVEEVEEFRTSNSEEELADIYEVLDSLIEFLQYEPMHIDYLKMKKKENRGSFKDRIFLEDVVE
ncbi:hypothetical protein GC105_16005 [Alkalibaculum sp. M08DMB]|uniref:Phosphoribosyl-ATP pyrophosphohydrolase n=1 Tax=Alkalibaculum sporogenes TaxID=2655001 RepID=A0A6A7KD64_9FIRM|nr:nucleoside triphosphate pyrophosphohydrolase [Alkalibaculum sporogenes]MPW27271.1 hypothetical protein [Alkalibaculum sporogenes]